MATPTRRRLTPSGYPLQKAEREKLNDERGVKPLPVNRPRDASRAGQRGNGKGSGELLYSVPRNEVRNRGPRNYAEAGASDIPVPPGPQVQPT